MGIQSPYLTLNETAAYLRVDPETVRKWLLRGQLKGDKLITQWRIKMEYINLFLKGNS